ncbi:GPW/gp25 family protein [Piscirickettsia litoralis]|uniref:IraD/Gp25-like domain-containing protein n=1 Tax=Piscirickettsia litoralis TaxID=1891921 RepID=A0ABX3A185_9GAMM|nr:hypothetical protein [Piscirickettsia litoralis]ODN41165.1 hypothetical protein BGC07_17990 [Piscirickettsia litoralis]
MKNTLDQLQGMCSQTGKSLQGIDYLFQLIGDCLTTPKNTRVMRRWYGTTLCEILDAPITDSIKIDIVMACDGALKNLSKELQDQGLPYFKVSSTQVEALDNGKLRLSISFATYPDGQSYQYSEAI